MPELVTYHGRPVKRRRRVRCGLQLVFYSSVLGEPGDVLIVSPSEWRRFGRIKFFPKRHMPNVRALAREFEV